MAPVAHSPRIAAAHPFKPRFLARGSVSKHDRVLKREHLHKIIRGLVEFVPPSELEYNDESLNYSIGSIEDDNLLYPEVELTCAEEDRASSAGSEGYSSASSALSYATRRSQKPARMSQLSDVGCSELVIPRTYNSKMARTSFYTAPKTAEELEKRNRNTVQARVSRAKVRAMGDLLVKEAEEAQRKNALLKMKLARSCLLASVLMEKLGQEPANFCEMWAAQQGQQQMMELGDHDQSTVVVVKQEDVSDMCEIKQELKSDEE